MEKCDECNGRGHYEKPCEFCNGKGEFPSSYDEEVEELKKMPKYKARAYDQTGEDWVLNETFYDFQELQRYLNQDFLFIPVDMNHLLKTEFINVVRLTDEVAEKGAENA